MGMKVEIGFGEAHVTDAEGIVWQERFTAREAMEAADWIDRLIPAHATPTARATLERIRDMLFALTNDSDACVVTVDPEQ
jgi:hypothetical protein